MTATLQILLLDDHRLIRDILKKEIENTLPPVKIHTAASYEQAITHLSTEKIDFAYLDFKLKRNKTGLDVLQYICSNELPTKAFILSAGSSSDGYLNREIIFQCMDAGAVGYISKIADSRNVLREAFDKVNQGLLYFPQECLKSNKKEQPTYETLEDFGIKGRLCEALYYICKPLSYKEVAKEMCIGEKTIRQNYAPNLFKKFNVENKEQLIVTVFQQNIEIPEPNSNN